jgi:hypothetical protein
MKYEANKIFERMLRCNGDPIGKDSTMILKKDLSTLDILKLSGLCGKDILPNPALIEYRHRNYDPDTVHKILDEIKEYDLTITAASFHYNISRNTLSKWMKETSRQK